MKYDLQPSLPKSYVECHTGYVGWYIGIAPTSNGAFPGQLCPSAWRSPSFELAAFPVENFHDLLMGKNK